MITSSSPFRFWFMLITIQGSKRPAARSNPVGFSISFQRRVRMAVRNADGTVSPSTKAAGPSRSSSAVAGGDGEAPAARSQNPRSSIDPGGGMPRACITVGASPAVSTIESTTLPGGTRPGHVMISGTRAVSS